MSEELSIQVEVTTRREGFNYEAAVMSALTAQEMAGGPRPEPDPDLIAWKMSGGQASGPRASGLLPRLLPDRETEPEAGS